LKQGAQDEGQLPVRSQGIIKYSDWNMFFVMGICQLLIVGLTTADFWIFMYIYILYILYYIKYI
jgi:hypothetical protein